MRHRERESMRSCSRDHGAEQPPALLPASKLQTRAAGVGFSLRLRPGNQDSRWKPSLRAGEGLCPRS